MPCSFNRFSPNSSQTPPAPKLPGYPAAPHQHSVCPSATNNDAPAPPSNSPDRSPPTVRDIRHSIACLTRPTTFEIRSSNQQSLQQPQLDNTSFSSKLGPPTPQPRSAGYNKKKTAALGSTPWMFRSPHLCRDPKLQATLHQQKKKLRLAPRQRLRTTEQQQATQHTHHTLFAFVPCLIRCEVAPLYTPASPPAMLYQTRSYRQPSVSLAGLRSFSLRGQQADPTALRQSPLCSDAAARRSETVRPTIPLSTVLSNARCEYLPTAATL